MPAAAPVVVGLDPTWRAVSALDWAAAEAALRGTGLVVAHAVAPAAVDAARDAEVVLDRARRRLAALGFDLDVQTVCRRADPVELLTAMSQAASLVVVGGPEAAGRDAVVDTTAVRLAATTAAPLAVVRGDHGRDLPADWPVLAALAEPAGGDPVLRVAFEAADREHRPLVAVHAWHGAAGELRRVLLRDRRSVDVERASLGAAMHAALATWSTEHPAVVTRADVALDGADRAVLERSAHAALLVLGIRRLRAARRLDRLPVVAPLLARTGPMLGISPLEEVAVWRSRCPVVLVPPLA